MSPTLWCPRRIVLYTLLDHHPGRTPTLAWGVSSGAADPHSSGHKDLLFGIATARVAPSAESIRLVTLPFRDAWHPARAQPRMAPMAVEDVLGRLWALSGSIEIGPDAFTAWASVAIELDSAGSHFAAGYTWDRAALSAWGSPAEFATALGAAAQSYLGWSSGPTGARSRDSPR